MTNKHGERIISRTNLEAHGIYYSPNGTYVLPDNISAVRDMLLSFEHIVPDGGWRHTLNKQGLVQDLEEIDESARYPPDSAWIHTEDHEVVKNPRWLAACESMDDCHMVAREAQASSRDSEEEWMLFWRMNTFLKVSGKAHDHSGFQ
jgi:hypothetical protein